MVSFLYDLVVGGTLTLLHSERPELFTILAILSAIGVKLKSTQTQVYSLIIQCFELIL